ncbi:Hypothetical protein BSM4216_1874 [Bacillus smithii]|nr:Hypothetical protein BSM4216_1874 [Bacillus smithii]
MKRYMPRRLILVAENYGEAEVKTVNIKILILKYDQ